MQDRRARKPQQEGNNERWMVSYADFITLLFAFFVVLFASSQTDKARARQISQAVEKALEEGRSQGIPPAVAKILGGTVDDKGQGNAMRKGPGGSQMNTQQPIELPAELTPSLKYLSKQLAEEIRDGKLEVKMEPRGLVVSLRQASFFPSGTDAVDPATYGVVQKLAEALGPIQNQVRIEGHTDSVPIHNSRFRSNWELSAARSIAVMDLLATRYDIAPSRMAIVGYADTDPVASNETEQGRAKNRRVDIVILNQYAMHATEPPKP